MHLTEGTQRKGLGAFTHLLGVKTLSPAIATALCHHNWSKNQRELLSGKKKKGIGGEVTEGAPHPQWFLPQVLWLTP